jgi:hypothetical protein
MVDVQVTFPGSPTINIGPSLADIVAALTPLVAAQLDAALTPFKEQIMTALEDLQADEAALDAKVVALVAEQATFLTDIAAALSAAGVDPTALAAVGSDITAQSAQLQTLLDAQVAADPATPVAPPAV